MTVAMGSSTSLRWGRRRQLPQDGRAIVTGGEDVPSVRRMLPWNGAAVAEGSRSGAAGWGPRLQRCYRTNKQGFTVPAVGQDAHRLRKLRVLRRRFRWSCSKAHVDPRAVSRLLKRGWKAMQVMGAPCRYVNRNRPVVTSQRRAVPSDPPVTTALPSRLNAAAVTGLA